MRNYRNYEIWKKAHLLVLRIYREIAGHFPIEEKYGLVSQLKRAAYSIALNIVEGCGRQSDREFARFLEIALGSAQEVEYCILLGFDLGFIPFSKFAEITNQVNELKAKIISLIKHIRKPIQ